MHGQWCIDRKAANTAAELYPRLDPGLGFIVSTLKCQAHDARCQARVPGKAPVRAQAQEKAWHLGSRYQVSR